MVQYRTIIIIFLQFGNNLSNIGPHLNRFCITRGAFGHKLVLLNLSNTDDRFSYPQNVTFLDKTLFMLSDCSIIIFVDIIFVL